MPDFSAFAGLTDDAIRLAAQTRELHPYRTIYNAYGGVPVYNRTEDRGGRRTGVPWEELNYSNGALLGMPSISYSFKHKPRGEFASFTAGWTVGLVTATTGAFLLAPALRFSAPLLSGPGSKVASALLVGYGSIGLGKFAARAVRTFANFDYNVRRLRMGGNYQDSATAQALRYSAVRDMGSTMGNPRSFLGNEARFLN